MKNAIFLMSFLLFFFAASFIPKNNAKNMNANIVSEVWVKAVAESANAIKTNACLMSILITAQNNSTRKDWDSKEGQCPHINPKDGGKENASMDKGSESNATVLLKSFKIGRA